MVCPTLSSLHQLLAPPPLPLPLLLSLPRQRRCILPFFILLICFTEAACFWVSVESDLHSLCFSLCFLGNDRPLFQRLFKGLRMTKNHTRFCIFYYLDLSYVRQWCFNNWLFTGQFFLYVQVSITVPVFIHTVKLSLLVVWLFSWKTLY